MGKMSQLAAELEAKGFTFNCYARHVGPWMIEPGYFSAAVAAVRQGTWPVIDAAERARALDSQPLYETQDGIAFVNMSGPMVKGDSKYGGVNTVRTRQALRAAAADTSVKAILLAIDSPGGTVAGTEELASEVANTKKPVYAQIDGIGASAAYWVASQAHKVFASATTEIGSIGTVAVVEDTSGAAEMAGIKVHVVSTGEYKGAFSDGAPVSQAQLDYLQQRVDDMNTHFLQGIANGRGMDAERVAKLADGRVMIASKAKRAGLIDGVQSMDKTVKMILDQLAPKRKAAENAVRAAAVKGL